MTEHTPRGARKGTDWATHIAVIGFCADEVGEKNSKAAIGARMYLEILIFF
jgi:hypothetical protein